MLRLAPQEAPASVLGLDGKDDKAAEKLTAALRKAFANRGLSGGEEISLEELRLTMGCDNDGVACLSQGGRTLGVRRLVFGYLEPTGGGYQLDIQILEVEGGKLESNASLQLSKADLSDKAIEQTATDVVNTLMPADTADAEIAPRADPLPEIDEPEIEPDPPEEKKEPRESKYEFGFDRPLPTWKKAGFATSLGLTVLAGGTTIGMAVYLRAKSVGFRKKLLAMAEESVMDEKALNDVPTSLPETTNLCDYAKARPVDPETGEPLGEPGQVRNAGIVRLCGDADDVRQAQLAAGISTAVFGAATIAFTVLMFVHKRKPAAAAMRRHQVQLGVAPNPEGGLSIGGGLRF